MASLFAVFSNQAGPDGNGILSFSGVSVSGTSAAASATPVVLSPGQGYLMPDLKAVTVLATVTIRTPQTGAVTASGSVMVKGVFHRSGNVVTQQGAGQSLGSELPAAFLTASARLVVDSSVTPNLITIQYQPPLLLAPAAAIGGDMLPGLPI